MEALVIFMVLFYLLCLAVKYSYAGGDTGEWWPTSGLPAKFESFGVFCAKFPAVSRVSWSETHNHSARSEKNEKGWKLNRNSGGNFFSQSTQRLRRCGFSASNIFRFIKLSSFPPLWRAFVFQFQCRCSWEHQDAERLPFPPDAAFSGDEECLSPTEVIN